MRRAQAAAGVALCALRHDYVEGCETSPVGYLEGGRSKTYESRCSLFQLKILQSLFHHLYYKKERVF